MFTPMSAAACSLNDTARMAVPILVFCTMNRSATSSTSVVTSTITWLEPMHEAAEMPGCRRNQVGKFARRRAEDGLVLAGVFDEQRHADGGDEHGELGPLAQRTVGEDFDQHAETAQIGHGQHQHQRAAKIGLRGQKAIHQRRENNNRRTRRA